MQTKVRQLWLHIHAHECHGRQNVMDIITTWQPQTRKKRTHTMSIKLLQQNKTVKTVNDTIFWGTKISRAK